MKKKTKAKPKKVKLDQVLTEIQNLKITVRDLHLSLAPHLQRLFLDSQAAMNEEANKKYDALINGIREGEFNKFVDDCLAIGKQRKIKEKKLNKKEHHFVTCYIQGFTADAAAAKAGYSLEECRRDLSALPHIANAIREQFKKNEAKKNKSLVVSRRDGA
jgi:hypothetical protein